MVELYTCTSYFVYSRYTNHDCHCIGSSLSHDGKIAVASSLSVFITTSILFFIFGYICSHYSRKNKQNFVQKPTPIYEDIDLHKIPKHEQNLTLKVNIAYMVQP